MKLLCLFSLFFMSLSFANQNKELRVAVIDTGLNIKDSRFASHICPFGSKDLTNTILNDTIGHGTFVTGLIEKYAKNSNYCLLIYKYYLDNNSGIINTANEIMAINEAIAHGANIINISGGGPEFNENEYLAIKNNPNVLFVVAAGNNNEDIANSKTHCYPASYFLPNEYVIGSLDELNHKAKFSNWSSKNKNFYWELGINVESYAIKGNTHGNGTSFSTAIFTGLKIRELSHE